VATANVGVAGSITASAVTGSGHAPVSIELCQTNPGTGACLAAPGASVGTAMDDALARSWSGCRAGTSTIRRSARATGASIPYGERDVGVELAGARRAPGRAGGGVGVMRA